MSDLFLFVGFPYVALAAFVVGSFVRFKMRQFSYSSLSTQFLENRWLAWASLPWHVGILIVLAGHFLAFLFPGVWSALAARPTFLFAVETLGIFASFLCLFGLVIFLVRRFVDAKLQAVTSYLDVAALLILLFQVSTGLAVALNHTWGAAWAPGALGPYLQGIFLFQPNPELITDLPLFVKMHIVSAWILLMIFPMTRLVHVLSLPFHYFIRSPQKVVWNSTRAGVRFEKRLKTDNERRLLIKSGLGAAISLILLSSGTLDKLFKFFLKQELTPSEEAHLLSTKLQRLKQTAEERELELERMSRETIFVARISELTQKKGKYFIDYLMRPALAFLDAKGFPIVLSAKCTHLGCTVGQDVDAQGRILCPCHVSYFDIKTGQPNAGSPAKEPLAPLGWAVKSAEDDILLEQDSEGKRQGVTDAAQLAGGSLFIVKRFI